MKNQAGTLAREEEHVLTHLLILDHGKVGDIEGDQVEALTTFLADVHGRPPLVSRNGEPAAGLGPPGQGRHTSGHIGAGRICSQVQDEDRPHGPTSALHRNHGAPTPPEAIHGPPYGQRQARRGVGSTVHGEGVPLDPAGVEIGNEIDDVLLVVHEEKLQPVRSR